VSVDHESFNDGGGISAMYLACDANDVNSIASETQRCSQVTFLPTIAQIEEQFAFLAHLTTNVYSYSRLF